MHKKHFFGWRRGPFFAIAERLLPESASEIVIDIGAGDDGFAQSLPKEKQERVHLLDGNPDTVKSLKEASFQSSLYQAPERLPFEDASVGFVHCSHLIEHLDWKELDLLLREIDRVAKAGAVIVISTPMHYDGFYGEISHVRPYYPRSITTPLCTGTRNSTISDFGGNYQQEELHYRYGELDPDQGWGSCNVGVDFLVYLLRRLFRKLSFRRYVKTGYTLVLRKNK